MPMIPRMIPEVKETVRRRREQDPAEIARGAVRVDLRQIEQFTIEARTRGEHEQIFIIDEAVGRGGLGKGASPLGHFLGGAAACFMVWIIKLAVDADMPFDDLKVLARGRINRHVGGGFEAFTYTVQMTSPEPSEKVRALLAQVPEYCFVHSTLQKFLPMKVELELNGGPAVAID